MDVGPDEVSRWVSEHVRPLSLEGVPELPPALSGKAVVGIASAVRSARELVLATHALLRALVADGVRAVAIEGTDQPYRTARALDLWVRTGEGDPDALLRASQGFLHHREAAAVLRWLRSYAREHPEDPVRVVHDTSDGDDPEDLASVERELARRDLAWHRRTGQRVAHWGGTAHVVAAPERVIPTSPWENHPNAGGLLRQALGDGYAVVALTFGRGSVPFPVPQVAPGFTEALLAGAPEPVLLALDDLDGAPRGIRRWASEPLVTRMIGPVYDPVRDTDFRVEAGPVAESVDALVHVPVATAVTPLPALAPSTDRGHHRHRKIEFAAREGECRSPGNRCGGWGS
ncbi:erythromycin esterase family protein [Pseudonocardia humida]|uniref:Erythromycin esterase family protein n=1 Tax=Pseudonocardia humida TaxID=2800819 RepID=A0ABT0ZSS7_9PSEU|nr:erythromycin esterase family protein [Pseudonocardia humida]MCO1653769.1 erythromycin esterase family protein [Pseudonocardia humida]